MIKQFAKGFILLVTLAALTASGFAFVYGLSVGCHYQQNQWNALHAVIKESTTIPEGYPATPETREQVKGLRARLYTAAGPRPHC